MPVIGQLIFSLIAKILENKLTRQNINDQAEEIVKQIDHEIYKRDRVIGILEAKLKELEDQVDILAFKKIDEIVKKVQEKTPFFVDPFVGKAGEVVKGEFDKFTDDLVKQIVDLAEKAKDKVENATGFDIDSLASKEVEGNPKLVDDVDKGSLDNLHISDKAKELLEDLKEKYEEKVIPEPTEEDEEGD